MRLELAIAFIFAVNVMFFLGQTAIVNINPDSIQFYNYSGSLLSKFDDGEYTLNQNVSEILPKDQAGVSIEDNANIFTDSFKAISNWFLDNTGINYLLGFLNAVPAFFACDWFTY